MKKKLFDRRGAAIELAMLMIVVCFSLSVLLLSTTMLLHNRKIRAEQRVEQSVALEQIGQEFLSAVVAGQVDESWLPAEDNGLTDEPIHRHSWVEEIVTEATCKDPGSKLLACADCGEEKTVRIPVAEHNWEWDSEKSQGYERCKSDGIYCDVCSYCGATKTTFIPAHLELDSTITITEEATCQKEGKRSYTCYWCQEAVVDEIIPVSKDHKWGEDGVCTDCGTEKPIMPIITYSLTAYRTAEKTVRYEVAVTQPGSAEITPAEPTEDKVILKIMIVFDEVDGTYLVTEWTKNDRS